MSLVIQPGAPDYFSKNFLNNGGGIPAGGTRNSGHSDWRIIETPRVYKKLGQPSVGGIDKRKYDGPTTTRRKINIQQIGYSNYNALPTPKISITQHTDNFGTKAYVQDIDNYATVVRPNQQGGLGGNTGAGGGGLLSNMYKNTKNYLTEKFKSRAIEPSTAVKFDEPGSPDDFSEDEINTLRRILATADDPDEPESPDDPDEFYTPNGGGTPAEGVKFGLAPIGELRKILDAMVAERAATEAPDMVGARKIDPEEAGKILYEQRAQEGRQNQAPPNPTAENISSRLSGGRGLNNQFEIPSSGPGLSSSKGGGKVFNTKGYKNKDFKKLDLKGVKNQPPEMTTVRTQELLDSMPPVPDQTIPDLEKRLAELSNNSKKPAPEKQTISDEMALQALNIPGNDPQKIWNVLTTAQRDSLLRTAAYYITPTPLTAVEQKNLKRLSKLKAPIERPSSEQPAPEEQTLSDEMALKALNVPGNDPEKIFNSLTPDQKQRLLRDGASALAVNLPLDIRPTNVTPASTIGASITRPTIDNPLQMSSSRPPEMSSSRLPEMAEPTSTTSTTSSSKASTDEGSLPNSPLPGKKQQMLVPEMKQMVAALKKSTYLDEADDKMIAIALKNADRLQSHLSDRPSTIKTELENFITASKETLNSEFAPVNVKAKIIGQLRNVGAVYKQIRTTVKAENTPDSTVKTTTISGNRAMDIDLAPNKTMDIDLYPTVEEYKPSAKYTPPRKSLPPRRNPDRKGKGK